MAARFTIFMRNGKAIDFESSSVKLEKDDEGIVTYIHAAARDNGMTLLYVKVSEIDAIVRDTSKEYQ